MDKDAFDYTTHDCCSPAGRLDRIAASTRRKEPSEPTKATAEHAPSLVPRLADDEAKAKV